MLERLIESTYSALDRDPHAAIAFRMQHPAGLAWSVKDRVLTASTEAGTPLLVRALRGDTLGGVIDALVATGCVLVYQDPELRERAADTLLSGSGRQSQSNGDAFRVYDSLLWSMLDASAVALEDADDEIAAGIRQLYLGTAEDSFLDEWGGYFGLPRDADETDDVYRVRIIVETLRPRVNRYAIEQAIFAQTGQSVTLYEPWKNLFRLSDSALSGADHFEDGVIYTHNVFQPQSTVSFDWTRVLAIIERNRPAGVLIAPTRFFGKMAVVEGLSDGMAIPFSLTDIRGLQAYLDADQRLDVFALGDSSVTPNRKLAASQLLSFVNLTPLDNPDSISRRRTIRRANIALSDSDPLGSVNAIFQRDAYIQPPEVMSLSGSSALSAYDGRVIKRPVDQVLAMFAGSALFHDVGGAAVSAGKVEGRGASVVAPDIVPGAVANTAIRAADVDDLSTRSVSMWSFSGAGAWSDGSYDWMAGTPWGSGLPTE